jgi:hypothetical protein
MQGPSKEGNAAKGSPVAAQSSQEGQQIGAASMGGAARPFVASFAEQSAVGHHSHCTHFVSGHGRGGWRQIGVAIPNHCVSPPGRVHMGTHVAVHAPGFGGSPPDLPSTIDRERASSRTSYSV